MLPTLAETKWTIPCICSSERELPDLIFKFTEAFAWMTEVAFEAEKLDHHPDWTNVYNTVNVLLSTHDENNLNEKDILLAKFMEKTFEKFN